MEQKIQLKHPAGKNNVRMDKTKYDTMRKALLNSLKKNGELTHTELLKCVIKELEKNKTKFEGSVGWYMESVKLDLEACKVIERVRRTSQQKYSIVK